MRIPSLGVGIAVLAVAVQAAPQTVRLDAPGTIPFELVMRHVGDAPALTMTAINELFEISTPYTLTVRRGGATLTVTLTPRVLF